MEIDPKEKALERHKVARVPYYPEGFRKKRKLLSAVLARKQHIREKKEQGPGKGK